MRVRVTQPHINASGPVTVGTIFDLHEDHAADYINARLAVPHVDDPQIPEATKPVEKATRNRKNKEIR
jgi:hypothetical protein